jgi:hypothetical protein
MAPIDPNGPHRPQWQWVRLAKRGAKIHVTTTQGGRVSTTEGLSDGADRTAAGGGIAMNLEVVVIPVSDPDRAKSFYAGLGWRLDADFSFDNGFRVVQFTPPGSSCSIQFGTQITAAAPGSAHGL